MSDPFPAFRAFTGMGAAACGAAPQPAWDAFVMEPGHDAWVVGDETCVLYDTAITTYATTS